jgi:hypothetical protein
MADLPFWSDDFDMDLPKVIPDARSRLGDLADFEMVTHGHTTHGRLNHPSVWNHALGSVAFFGRHSPMKPASYWTDHPLVRCTLWETIRDAWSHDFVVLFEHNPIWNGQSWGHFEPLMYHIRGWREVPEREVKEHKACVIEMIDRCRMLLQVQLDRESTAVSAEAGRE